MECTCAKTTIAGKEVITSYSSGCEVPEHQSYAELSIRVQSASSDKLTGLIPTDSIIIE